LFLFAFFSSPSHNFLFLVDGFVESAWRQAERGRVFRNGTTEVTSDSKPNALQWFHYEFPSQRISVIAIRGTQSFPDGMIDLAWWLQITVLRLCRFVMPMLEVFPRPFISEFIKTMMPNVLGSDSDLVFGEIIRYTRRLRKDRPDNTILVVGHSLGGGSASIVSASVFNVSGWGVSPSGMMWNSYMFGIGTSYVYSSFSSVIPDTDPIPAQVKRHIPVQL
jgi:hypothetical protein